MAQAQFVWMNGSLVPKEQAAVPLYDHGLLYGDGIFEGIRVYNNRVFKLDEHVARLYYSAQALNITMPAAPRAMREAILETARANAHENGYIRVTVTRGTGLGLDPKHVKTAANVYISCEQLSLYPQELYDKGLIVATVSTRLPSPDVIDPRVKCTGKYINNIMAKAEANRQGAGEGLMLTREGYVGEATGDNLFLVKDGAHHHAAGQLGHIAGHHARYRDRTGARAGHDRHRAVDDAVRCLQCRRSLPDGHRRRSDRRRGVRRAAHRRRQARPDHAAIGRRLPRAHGCRAGVPVK